MKAAVLHQFKDASRHRGGSPPRARQPMRSSFRSRLAGCATPTCTWPDGDWKQFAGIAKRPLILGHEVVGRVVEEREARPARAWDSGDRVGVPWLHWTCGSLRALPRGQREPLCQARAPAAVTVDGGFAEFLKDPGQPRGGRFPSCFPRLRLPPLLCPGLTAYRALKQSGILPGERLAVFGIGQLGHLAVQHDAAAWARR